MKKKMSVAVKKIIFIIIGFFMLVLVGVFDYQTGKELNFSIFYLLPIAFVTWHAGRNIGIVTAVLSALIWVMAEEQTRISSFILWWEAIVRLSFYLFALLTLSALKTKYAREKQFARIDFLTGIANSTAFFERAKIEKNRCARNRRPLTIAYMDCDYFKNVNDAFGHKRGDALLKLIANNIKNNIRITDMVAHIGGDEFLILMPEATSEAAGSVTLRIQNELLKLMKWNNLSVTFSMGVATFITPLDSIDEMVKKADELMSFAKNNGRNQIRHEEFK